MCYFQNLHLTWFAQSSEVLHIAPLFFSMNHISHHDPISWPWFPGPTLEDGPTFINPWPGFQWSHIMTLMLKVFNTMNPPWAILGRRPLQIHWDLVGRRSTHRPLDPLGGGRSTGGSTVFQFWCPLCWKVCGWFREFDWVHGMQKMFKTH